MHYAGSCWNLGSPTFLFLSPHHDIMPQSTAAYRAVLTSLSSTSIPELRVMLHPHLADSINAHSQSSSFAACHNANTGTPFGRPHKKETKKIKQWSNHFSASIDTSSQNLGRSLEGRFFPFPPQSNTPSHLAHDTIFSFPSLFFFFYFNTALLSQCCTLLCMLATWPPWISQVSL